MSSTTMPPDFDPKNRDETSPLNSLFYPRKPDKTAYAEWINRLTPEELNHYTQIGYKFKLLGAIFEHPEIIALPGEKASARQLNFAEVMDMMDELHDHSRLFLGKDLERNTTDAAALTSFFRALHHIGERGLPSREADQEFIQAVTIEFRPYMRAGGKQRPSLMDRFAETLKMSDGDKSALLKAVDLIREEFKKIQDAGKDNMFGQLRHEALEGIILALSEVDCLRRVFPQNKKVGLKEIVRIKELLEMWKDLFGELLPDNDQGITIAMPDQTDVPGSPTPKKNMQSRRVFLEHRAKALGKSFPNLVTPMVMMHHRQVLKKKIKQYEKVTDMVEGMEDKELRDLLEIFLASISRIMSYLEFMWDMHKVESDKGTTQILYPKKMLLLIPVIREEMQKLSTGFQMLGEKYRGQRDTDLRHSLHSELGFSKGLGTNDDSQTEFSLDIGEESAARTQEITAAKARQVLDSSPDEPARNDNLAFVFNMIGEMVIADHIRKADDHVELIGIEKVKKRLHYGDPGIVVHPETLTHHIQDFINEVQAALTETLVELINAFREKRLPTRNIIPEYQDYEDQAAELRYGLKKMFKNTSSAKDKLQRAMVHDPADAKNPDKGAEAVLRTKVALTEIADAITRFQQTQESALAGKKYHGVLKGEHYGTLNNLSHGIMDYFLDGGVEALTPEILATHDITKKIEEFGEKFDRKSKKPAEVDEWLDKYYEFRKLRMAVPGKPAKGKTDGNGEMAASHGQALMAVVDGIKKLAEDQAESVPQETTPGEHAEDKEFKDCRERFRLFATENPFLHRVREEQSSSRYREFDRLVKQFEDFHTMLGMTHSLVDERLLYEHDGRLANEVADKLEILALEMQISGKAFPDGDGAFSAITDCQAALQHLQFRDAGLARDIHEIFDYFHSYPEFLSAHEEKVKDAELDEMISAIRRLQKRLRDLITGYASNSDSLEPAFTL
ncbi:MAG TPA: hypothetical protein VI588_01825 [Candidatus Gracilibacteria bacterium]|nr:hypothetical protein [Candidatus Gracilibacteria bacterium]